MFPHFLSSQSSEKPVGAVETSTKHKKLLIATNNNAKVREFREIFVDLPFELRTLMDEGIEIEVPETGSTFVENAVIKAEAYARLSGLLTMADDSGLEVDALGGEPGVFSARYAGPGATDDDRNSFLLAKLREVPLEKRTARFRCAIAVAEPDEETQVVEGTVEGRISLAPSGKNGFGYDPIFFLPDLGKTMGELDGKEKNAISHRSRAARAAREILMNISSM